MPAWVRFSTPVQTLSVADRTPSEMVADFFPGLKRPGCGVDNPLPSKAEVKEKVELTSTTPLGLHGLL